MNPARFFKILFTVILMPLSLLAQEKIVIGDVTLDIPLPKSRVGEWREAILAANPGGTPSGAVPGSASTPGSKILRYALIGAGVGAVIALLNKITARKET